QWVMAEKGSSLSPLREEAPFREIKGRLERRRRNHADLGMAEQAVAQDPPDGARANSSRAQRQGHTQQRFLAQELGPGQGKGEVLDAPGSPVGNLDPQVQVGDRQQAGWTGQNSARGQAATLALHHRLTSNVMLAKQREDRGRT